MDLGPDSAINFSINYYKEKSDKEHLAKAYFYKARKYKYAQQFENATKYYLNSLDLIKDGKNFEVLGKINSDLGDIASIQKDYQMAREKYNLAINYFKKVNKIDYVVYRTIDIGRTYRNEGNFNAANEIFKNSLKTEKDSVLLGIILQELGVSFWYARNIDSSLVYLYKSLLYPYKGNDFSIRCFTLADLYFTKEDYDSATFYANKALRYPIGIFTKKECYRVLANTSYLKGDYKQMADYMTMFQVYSDSVGRVKDQTKATVIEDIYQSSEKVSKTRHWLMLVGSILPFVIAITLLIYFRLKKKNKGNEEKLEQQEEKIVQVTQELHQKHDLLKASLLQKIEDTRSLQMNKYKKASVPEREIMDKVIYHTCLHINNWKEFSGLMNYTFNNIVDFLEKKFPGLSKREIIYCCLTLLDFSTYDMTLVLECQTVSLYKLRQRIVQKMGMENTKELDNYLKENFLKK
ncbi:MAG: tetratricopeptide repeat protein [Paludibacter sp.]|nr:tetratricopeptide repeat protein [Paludibacter sp.]